MIDGRTIVDRGIGGQTSGQTLARFYQDVIALHPKVVQILTGTNDIAGNLGPEDDAEIENNIRAMCELAQTYGIHVVLASITPAATFPWVPGSNPKDRIHRLNAFLHAYARERKAVFVDYNAILNDGAGGLIAKLGNDGVHSNRDGYALMRLPP